jgi:cellulose biosynthesis protein BcsQ
MPLILCHSPKGGVGTTFVAAHLAMALADMGLRTKAVDMTRQDSLKLYFGIKPINAIPDLHASDSERLLIGGVSLRQGYRAAHDPSLCRCAGQWRPAFYARHLCGGRYCQRRQRAA